jgi:hypothetical protein
MKYQAQPKIIHSWQIKGTKLTDIWTVNLWSDGHFDCNCPSFSFGPKRFCKHTQIERFWVEDTYGNISNFIKMLKENEKPNIS